jgi:hypothetical protein
MGETTSISIDEIYMVLILDRHPPPRLLVVRMSIEIDSPAGAFSFTCNWASWLDFGAKRSDRSSRHQPRIPPAGTWAGTY